MVELSVVIPIYNEKENVEKLYEELVPVLTGLKKSFEVIFVDDGSTDGTSEILEKLSKRDRAVKIIRFTRNFGQTAALFAGFKHARGKIIVSMDADLQNNPNDIPKMLKKLESGYDTVCGWRIERKDSVGKIISSKISNWLMGVLVGPKIHDSGCTLRVYKKEVVSDLTIYGETHRFIPAMIASQGFRVTELPVGHRKRFGGKTKYGLARLPKGLLDLLTLKFLIAYGARPVHVFGSVGLGSLFLGFLGGLYLMHQKFILERSIGGRPLLILVLLLIILGVLFILNGFLAELIIRTRATESYKIKKIVGG